MLWALTRVVPLRRVLLASADRYSH